MTLGYITAVFVLLAFLIVYQGIMMYEQNKRHEAHITALVGMWDKERNTLLDRIQAPSFAEYKQGEIRMVKAQKDEKPESKIELC